MNQYDLHTHTTASDGSLTPTELVARAHAAGVDLLAVTDHDTLDGLAEAHAAAAELGLPLLNGVEISVTWNGVTVHIVGLDFDAGDQRLREGLAGIQEHRDWRAEEIGRRLAKKGIEGAFEGARRFSGGKLVSRTHFARFLVEQGYVSSVREVFQHYLVRNKPGYVAGDWASLEQAVGWIRDAGGQAVVAHPARYKLTRSKRLRLFGEFMELGGEAIEVISGSHSRDEAFTMANHCRELGLLASTGSDYHGPENPWVELGRLPALPPGCRPLWERWPAVRRAINA